MNSREETFITGKGAIKVAYLAWKKDRLPKGREAIARYCEYLSAHEYGANAGDMLLTLDAMTEETAIGWITYTVAEFVTDLADMMKYVYGLRIYHTKKAAL